MHIMTNSRPEQQVICQNMHNFIYNMDTNEYFVTEKKKL